MKIKEFFQESNGRFSAARLFSLFVCFAAIIDWMYSVFNCGVWQPSNQTVAIIIASLCLKVIQKGKENVK